MRISDWSSDVCSSDLISNITPNPPAAIPVSSADPLVKKSRNCWLPAFSGHVQAQRWRAHVSMTPRLAIFRLALLATSAFIRTRLNKKEFSYDDTSKQRNGDRKSVV